MGFPRLADALRRQVDDVGDAALPWRSQHPHHHAVQTLERSSVEQLCRARDAAQQCGALNMMLRLHAIFDDQARALLRDIDDDEAWRALGCIELATVTNPSPVVWSTLLLASSDDAFRAGEAYFDWLAPQAMPVILEGFTRLKTLTGGTTGPQQAPEGRPHPGPYGVA